MNKKDRAAEVHERLVREAETEAARTALDTEKLARDLRRLSAEERRRLLDRS